MGLSNLVHWVAWFITSFITMFISVVILAILLKQGQILVNSDITVIIFILLMFTCSSIALAFLISVFFGKANIAAACGGIIYFFTYLPYPITLWFEEQMNFSQKGFAVSLEFELSIYKTIDLSRVYIYIMKTQDSTLTRLRSYIINKNVFLFRQICEYI